MPLSCPRWEFRKDIILLHVMEDAIKELYIYSAVQLCAREREGQALYSE